MRTKVYFNDHKDAADKLAIAVGTAAGIRPDRIPPSFMPENLPIIYIGLGTYGGKKPTKDAIEFITCLDPARCKKVALYGVKKGEDDCFDFVKAILDKKGVELMENKFFVAGQTMFNKKSPTAEDMEAIKVWTKDIEKEVLDSL